MKTANPSILVRSLATCASAWILALLVASAIPVLGAASAAPPVGLSPSALSEIAAVLKEKATWTPVQCKMESALIHAMKKNRGQAFAPGAPALEMEVKVQPDGRVLVDLQAKVTPALLALIAQGGGQVVNSFPQFKAIRARVMLEQLETLAATEDLTFLRRADEAYTSTGSVTSQGDVTHAAASARSTFGVGGAGVKVAVLSDSVDHLATSQALGDLGPVTVLSGQSGVPGTGEGTAMLEIVADLAPAAQLYFATAVNGQASFAQNILNLRQNGCAIIIDDVGYFSESPFQDGVIAQAVNTVTAGGALYFSAAANSGHLDAGTSGTWEGDFLDGGPVTFPEPGRIHSFGAATYNTCVTGGRVDLFWSDPLGGSANDYDLFVLDSTGATVLRSSTTRQTGTQDPYEQVSTLNVGERIVIVQSAGAARFLHLSTGRGRLAIPTAGATCGHSAATNSFSVAAVSISTAYPGPFTGGAGNPVETFSSDGPRHVFYNADGTAITPGDFSSTGGAIRQKPDLTAADGVVTTFPLGGGLNPFYGTSAAAPHAGAIAALLLSLHPSLTPSQVRYALTNTALDVLPYGWDQDSGWGIVMADRALALPWAGFTASPQTGAAALNVTFTDASSGVVTGWFWDFGDGSTLSAANPTAQHTYTNAGAYSPSLTVSGPGGTTTLTRTNYIVVINASPVAGFVAAPTNGAAPLAVTFTNLAIRATDCLWSFGDGTATNSLAATVLHTYANAGVYSPSLSASGLGGTDTLTRTNYIIVTNAPPVAHFVADRTSGPASLPVTFTNTTVGLTTNLFWSFDDGTTTNTTAPTIMHIYATARSYSPTLTAEGPGGTDALTRTNYIVVTNGPPEAYFTASPANGPAALRVAFNDTSSGVITNRFWDFGNGVTTNTTLATFGFAYNTAGTNTVSLTVSGPAGTNQLTRPNYIVVTNAPPVADFVAWPTNGAAPLTVSFTNLSTGATNYVWSFGDGNTNNSLDATNTYFSAGSYTVSLTALGALGTTNGSKTNYIVVTNPLPPTVDFVAWPTHGTAPLTVYFTNLATGATNYLWSFGDGNTSTSFHAANTYNDAGSYTVTLTAMGFGGTTLASKANYIVVTNPPLNVAAYGDNSFGQCSVPVEATNAIAVAAGAWHSLALHPGGQVAAWGWDSDGQCDVPPTLTDAVAIAAGGYHNLAIKANGTVAAWGANGYGQAAVPAGLTNVIGIAAGSWHSVALRANGTVVVWGDNSFGQTNQPGGLTNVLVVAAGGNHSLALKTDGTLVAWGENTDAAGNVAGQSVVPLGLANVVAIGAGEYHSLAVKADGTVVAWGDASQGQCDVSPGLTNAVAVAGGGAHTLALKADGALDSWGADWYGQRDIQPALTNSVAVAAGEDHTLVLLDAGVPELRLFNPACKRSQFIVLLQTVNRRNYVLEYKNSLAETNWTALATNRGNGALIMLADSGAGVSRRFYRARRW